MLVTGAAAAMQRQPRHYGELVQRATSALSNGGGGGAGGGLPAAAAQITLDLPRTFPRNTHFNGKDTSFVAALRRVLLAFSSHRADIRYVQVRSQRTGGWFDAAARGYVSRTIRARGSTTWPG